MLAPMTTTTCPGYWGEPREIGSDSGITVQRCTGCADLLVIYRGRAHDVPAGADDRTIAATVWEAVGRSVEPRPMFEAVGLLVIDEATC